jgi:hypothetical protein
MPDPASFDFIEKSVGHKLKFFEQWCYSERFVVITRQLQAA